jgi:hypothetical protein
LQLVEEEIDSPSVPAESIAVPPPAPRPISDSYVWRIMFTDGWAVSAFVFCLLGAIFCVVGIGLTLGIITAFIGIPFLLLGLGFLVVAVWVLSWRYKMAYRVVNVLRMGEAVRGQIVEVSENYSVRINGRHPWTIRYQFQVNGQDHAGSVSTLNPVGENFQPGKAVYVLYLPDVPELNSLFPHP